MAKVLSKPPQNKDERRVFDQLARELDDSWLLGSNIRYVSKESHGRTVDREIDIFLAHETYGIVVIEVKGGRLKRDSGGGWLHYKSETKTFERTNAFQQVHEAKRNIIRNLKDGGLTSRVLTVTPYVLFASMTRPDGPLGPEANDILLFGSDLPVGGTDSFLKRLKSDLAKVKVERIDLPKLQSILFPDVNPEVYKPPKPTTDLTGLEEQIAILTQQVEELRKSSSTRDLHNEVKKLLQSFEKVAKEAPQKNVTNDSAIEQLSQQVRDIAELLVTRTTTDQSRQVADSLIDPNMTQVKNEVSQATQAIVELLARLDREREEEATRAETDIKSVEQALDELKKMVTEFSEKKPNASLDETLAPIKSTLGAVTARITQLSHVVDARVMPANRFEKRVDELAMAHRDIARRLEKMMSQESPELKLLEQTSRDLQAMKRQFAEFSAAGAGRGAASTQPVRRGRQSKALIFAVLIAVFVSGAVLAANMSDRDSEKAVYSPVTTASEGFARLVSTIPASETTTSPLSTVPQAPVSSTSTSSATPVLSTTVPAPPANTVEPVTSVTASLATQGSRVTFAPVSRPTTTLAQALVVPTSAAVVSVPLSVSQIDFGEKHSCVLNPAGDVYCWGSNDAGQLGSPTFGGSFSAAPVKADLGATKIKSLAAGRFHTCALDVNGQAFCWGLNASGQLGLDSTDRVVSVARPVFGGLTFSSLASGAVSTCGLTTDARVFCWGGNGNNELASDSGYSSPKPVEVSGGWRFSKLEVGQNSLGCGVETTGLLLCWGYSDDEYGAIEQYLYDMRFNAAVMGVGADHVCLIVDGVDLRCISWYTNSVGGVGDNRESMGRSKGRLPEPFVTVVGGFRETCGLTADGRVYCWGDRPTLVESDERFVSLVVRSDRKCGVTASNELYCWGKNADGRSSSGLTTGKPSPVALFVN